MDVQDEPPMILDTGVSKNTCRLHLFMTRIRALPPWCFWVFKPVEPAATQVSQAETGLTLLFLGGPPTKTERERERERETIFEAQICEKV